MDAETKILQKLDSMDERQTQADREQNERLRSIEITQATYIEKVKNLKKNNKVWNWGTAIGSGAAAILAAFGLTK